MAFTPIQLMLAASEIPEPHEIPFPMLFSLKYDGVRNAVIDRNCYSRNMELWPNAFTQGWFYKYGDELEGFDGELIVGPPNAQDVFQRTMSGITSEAGVPDFKFYVFDLWNEKHIVAEERYSRLCGRVKKLHKDIQSKIVVVTQHRLLNYGQVKTFYDKAIADKYEGLIGKHPGHVYKHGRSTLNQGTLLKFKEFADSEIRIIRIDQGKSNQNKLEQDALGYAKRSTSKAGKVKVQTVGTFIGIDVNPTSPFYGQEVRVGPGDFKKTDLEALWQEHQNWLATLPPHKLDSAVGPVLGRYLTYKYQVTGVKDAPRYPGAKAAKGFRSTSDFNPA